MANIDVHDVTIVQESKFPFHHTYKTNGYKKVYMSDNISALCLRGLETNGIEKQLISAYINVNIPQVDESCFANCINMTAINANNNIKSVGDYAFYNCKSLQYLNFLGTGNNGLMHTGDYAFAKSGLKKITLNLKSSVSDTSHGSYTFYECTDLQEANLEGAPYLASHMFDGCTSLSKVMLNDRHSYVNSYCFANCTSLESIQLPANCYMLASHMFDGCTNLKSVTFKDGSILKQLEDHVFANCPKLTSITLPQSINSLSTIDSEFLAGSNMQKVIFSGMPSSDFVDEERVIVDLKFNVGEIYETQLKQIWECAEQNHVPIVAWLSKGRNHGCGRCDNFYNNVYDPLLSWFKSTKYFYLAGNYKEQQSDYINLEAKISNYSLDIPGKWIYLYLFWKKEDGSIVKWTSGSISPQASYKQDFKDRITTMFAGYSGDTEIRYLLKSNITTFGKGPGLSVTYADSQGNEYVCGNDTIIRKPEYRTDIYTNSDFKYGIWYYNIKELKKFADDNHIPLIAEWSHAGCDPCIDFKKNTWQNKDFQDEIKKRPCLLCRIECQPYESWDTPVNSERYYISHVFGDSKTLIPQFVFYWNKNGTDIRKEIWNYNYRADPANANYQTVLNKIDSFIAGYKKDPGYAPPIQYASSNGKFKYYSNEENDSNGKYFICDDKKAVNKYQGTQLSIDISDGVTGGSGFYGESLGGADVTVLDNIEVNQEVTIPAYTYQYFTTAKGDSFIDRNGVIFKVEKSGSSNKISYIYQFENYEQSTDPILEEEPYKVGQMIEISQSTSYDSFNSIVEYCTQNPTKLLVIFKLNNNMQSESFISSILQSSKFKKWLRKSPYIFIKAQSIQWDSNAPKAIEDFESSVKFKNKTNDIPKILVFRGCASCTVDEPYAVECRQEIKVQSDSIDYYTGLIDEYSTYFE